MELRHLRYAVAVADTGSTAAAARRLHVAQQALSRQVADLEREIGIRLFTRSARGMQPTRAGLAFLAYAREALAANARALAEVRRVGAERRRLRVGLWADLGPGGWCVASATVAFRAQYPHVEVALVPDAPFPSHVTAVSSGSVDVGFHLGFAPDASAGTTSERVLWGEFGGVLLPAGHRLASTPTVAAPDLSGTPQVSFPHAANPALVDDELTRLRAAGWRGRLDVEAGDALGIAQLVACGAGWVHVPTYVAHASLPPGTVYRALAERSGTPAHLHAVTRDDADPLAAAFLACLREAGRAIASGE